MSIDGQGTLWRRNIAENFNRLSRVHQRYRLTTERRQTTDRRQTDRRVDDDIIANVNVSSRSLKNPLNSLSLADLKSVACNVGKIRGMRIKKL